MLVAASTTLFAGCFGHAPTPMATVQFGPAREFFAQRVISMPAYCAPADASCDNDYLRAVDAQVRMELEFHGHTVVDAESLNAGTTAYTQRVGKKSTITPYSTPGATEPSKSTDTTQTKQLFADATPEVQQSVLDGLMIDGWLTSRVDMSSITGATHTRHIQVTIKLSRRQDDSAIWTSRCDVISGLHLTQAVAMSRTTECALQSLYDAMQRTTPQGPR